MYNLFKTCLIVVICILVTSLPATNKEKRITIGAIVPTLEANFWNRYFTFMKKGARDLGIKLIFRNADNKKNLISEHIEEFVEMGVDGIIFVPYWNSGKKGIKIAAKKNIPVILTDCYLEDVLPFQKGYENYISFIGPADESAGYQMAIALFDAVIADENGKKNIAVVNGTPGTSVAIDRRKGLEKALKEHPEIVVVGEVNGNFVRSISEKVMTELYIKNKNIKGVWCANGGTASGVISSIKYNGKKPGKDIMVVAMDLNDENVNAIRNGELVFDIGGHWLQGGFALVKMYDYLQGFNMLEKNNNVKLDLLPLNKKYMSQFERQYPGGLPEYDFKEHSKKHSYSLKEIEFTLKYKSNNE